MNDTKHTTTSFGSCKPVHQVADMPYPLYLSLQGKYFVGYADHMAFGNGSVAWAGLVNPIHSGVDLFIYVWTVTNIGTLPLTADIRFNITPPGQPFKSEFVTPANTALCPLPTPKVLLLQANHVTPNPIDGAPVFEKKVLPEVTIASDEQGRFIIPPGGSFIITLLNTESSSQIGQGRVAFGWSEEPLVKINHRRYQ